MTESPHERKVHGPVILTVSDEKRCKPRRPALCKSYAFGDNSFLQLGVGDTLDRHVPVRSAYTEKFNVIDVAVGAYHTLILLDNNNVYGWGGNNMGELGLGHTTRELEPKLVVALVGKRVRYLYAANYHSFALCMNGDIYAFGENENYELGLGDNDNRQTPQRIDALAGQQIEEICTAEMHTFGITTDRRVYGWGNNYNGELGLGDVSERSLPEEVLAFRDIPLCKIRCGGSFSAALSVKGVLYTWGINCYGQLGLADVVNRSTPEVVKALNGIKIIDIAVGSAQSVCLAEDGTVYVWGYNGRGELGLGDQTDRMLPTILLEGYSDARLFGYPCSRHFFIYKKGRVIVWGVNSNGQLGVGDSKDRDRPEELVALRDQFKQYEEVHFVIGYCSTFALFSFDQSLAVMMYSIWKRNMLSDIDFIFYDEGAEPARKKRKQ